MQNRSRPLSSFDGAEWVSSVTVRIAFWNLQDATTFKLDDARVRTVIMSLISRDKLDVLFLCELKRTGGVDRNFLANLARFLNGIHTRYLHFAHDVSFGEGMGVLWDAKKVDVSLKKTIDVNGSRNVPIYKVQLLDGKAYEIACVHFPALSAKRSAVEVWTEILPALNGAHFVGGDFNFQPQYSQVFDGWNSLLCNVPTMVKTNNSLDNVFASRWAMERLKPEAGVESHRKIVFSEGKMPVSDHFPILLEFEGRRNLRAVVDAALCNALDSVSKFEEENIKYFMMQKLVNEMVAVGENELKIHSGGNARKIYEALLTISDRHEFS